MFFNEAKDTFFYKKKTLNCGGRILDLSSPVVMGILNLTPDSFYDGGKYTSEDSLLLRTRQMLDDGAGIIDLGACSTRPGSEDITEDEEKARLLPALKLIRKNFPEAVLSVDTYRSSVAKEAVDAGAGMINDISGGSFDTKMFSALADLKVPYILMHIKGRPADMQKDPEYSDVLREVFDHFTEKLLQLKELGITDCIIDPGFGFGKDLKHNFTLLKGLDVFKVLGFPVMVGVSRKSMINKVLKTRPDEALNGTTVLNTLALLGGASILRVHDVKEAVEAVKLVSFFRDS